MFSLQSAEPFGFFVKSVRYKMTIEARQKVKKMNESNSISAIHVIVPSRLSGHKSSKTKHLEKKMAKWAATHCRQAGRLKPCVGSSLPLLLSRGSTIINNYLQKNYWTVPPLITISDQDLSAPCRAGFLLSQRVQWKLEVEMNVQNTEQHSAGSNLSVCHWVCRVTINHFPQGLFSSGDLQQRRPLPCPHEASNQFSVRTTINILSPAACRGAEEWMIYAFFDPRAATSSSSATDSCSVGTVVTCHL